MGEVWLFVWVVWGGYFWVAVLLGVVDFLFFLFVYSFLLVVKLG